MAWRENLTGRVFGRWTVLRLDHVRPSRIRYWLCRCICGTQRAVSSGNLKNGTSASCGCMIGVANKKRSIKHGMADTKPHMIWQQMRQRCGNPRHKAFHSYGGRGIKVCERWQDFVLFWQDMGQNYQEGMSIERINNDGHYEPGNCVWVVTSEQSKNRRPSSEWRRSNDKIITSSRGI